MTIFTHGEIRRSPKFFLFDVVLLFVVGRSWLEDCWFIFDTTGTLVVDPFARMNDQVGWALIPFVDLNLLTMGHRLRFGCHLRIFRVEYPIDIESRTFGKSFQQLDWSDLPIGFISRLIFDFDVIKSKSLYVWMGDVNFNPLQITQGFPVLNVIFISATRLKCILHGHWILQQDLLFAFAALNIQLDRAIWTFQFTGYRSSIDDVVRFSFYKAALSLSLSSHRAITQTTNHDSVKTGDHSPRSIDWSIWIWETGSPIHEELLVDPSYDRIQRTCPWAISRIMIVSRNQGSMGPSVESCSALTGPT